MQVFAGITFIEDVESTLRFYIEAFCQQHGYSSDTVPQDNVTYSDVIGH